jgi:hypothetical protein
MLPDRTNAATFAILARKGRWLSVLLLAIFVVTFFREIYNLPLAAYVQDINVDDSFYYYSIARNFSHGLFSTVDGFNLTNGYHPLWA